MSLLRRRGSIYGLLSGIAIGTIVSVLVLATAARPLSPYQWPPASRVENAGMTVYYGAFGGIAQEYLGSNCTTMIADVDSGAPVEVWVTPFNASLNMGAAVPPSSFYYWSGLAGVEQVSLVITDVNPTDGVALSVYDPNHNADATASFGYAFEETDC